MEVYKSNYLHLFFLAETELIQWFWLPATKNMIAQEYKQEILNYRDIVVEYRPKKLLANLQAMQFIISPELQEWTNQTVFPQLLAVGLSKVAILLSKEMITDLATEQLMDESEGIKFYTRYFDNEAEAKAWILAV